MGDKIQISVGIDSTKFRSGLAEMKQYGAKFKEDMRSNMLGAVAGVSLVTAALSALKRAFAKGMQMETLLAQFKTLLGSTDAAKQRMKDLSDFAASTPFELPEIAAASRTLETLTNGALSTGEGLRVVGDAAATAQVPFEELAVTIGRVHAGIAQGSNTIGSEVNRLVELGLVSNSTKTQVAALMEAGKKGSEVWALIAADLGRFNGQMEAMGSTTAGKISTLSDAWDGMLRAFAQPFLEEVSNQADGATSAIEDLTEGAGYFGKFLASMFHVARMAMVPVLTFFVALQDSIANVGRLAAASFGGLGDALAALKVGDFKGMIDAAKSTGAQVQDILVQAGRDGMANLEAGKDEFMNEFGQIKGIMNGKKSDDDAKGQKVAVGESPDDAENKAAQKREERMEAMRKREEEAMRDKLEGEEKINALIAERDRLLQQAEEATDDDKAVDKLEEAQKLQREIEREQKAHADDMERKAEEQRKKDEQDLMDIANAREEEAKARKDAEFDQMTPQQKIFTLQKEKKTLEEDAARLEETDPAAAAKKRTEAIGVTSKLRDEQGKLAEENKRKAQEAMSQKEKEKQAFADRQKSAASVPVSSLQAVGGGGRAGPSSSADPVLREAQRQSQSLQEVVMLLRQQLGATSAPKAAPSSL